MSKPIFIRINDDIHRELVRIAAQEKRSITKQVEFFLEEIVHQRCTKQEESECQRTQLEQVR